MSCSANTVEDLFQVSTVPLGEVWSWNFLQEIFNEFLYRLLHRFCRESLQKIFKIFFGKGFFKNSSRSSNKNFSMTSFGVLSGLLFCEHFTGSIWKLYCELKRSFVIVRFWCCFWNNILQKFGAFPSEGSLRFLRSFFKKSSMAVLQKFILLE